MENYKWTRKIPNKGGNMGKRQEHSLHRRGEASIWSAQPEPREVQIRNTKKFYLRIFANIKKSKNTKSSQEFEAIGTHTVLVVSLGNSLALLHVWAHDPGWYV